MRRSKLLISSGVTVAVLAIAGHFIWHCRTSSHPVQPSALGTSSRSQALLAVIDQPGPLTVETVDSADWQVSRAGLINLKNEKAKAAGLQDGDEPISIFFHVIRHPERGLFIVDTGVDTAQRDDPENAGVRGLAAKLFHAEKFKIHLPLGEFLKRQSQPLAGVFLTHLHADHVSGMRDVPHGTPIYSGPGETAAENPMNVVGKPVTDRLLEGQQPINEWQFRPDADGRFEGVVDVFGDGSLWALSVPGHTPGSTAYLARTAEGPVLLVGDTCHTAWGWENEVEPGDFTADQTKNRENLLRLRKLAAEHPAMGLRFGHQLPRGASAAAQP